MTDVECLLLLCEMYYTHCLLMDCLSTLLLHSLYLPSTIFFAVLLWVFALFLCSLHLFPSFEIPIHLGPNMKKKSILLHLMWDVVIWWFCNIKQNSGKMETGQIRIKAYSHFDKSYFFPLPILAIILFVWPQLVMWYGYSIWPWLAAYLCLFSFHFPYIFSMFFMKVFFSSIFVFRLGSHLIIASKLNKRKQTEW